MKKVNIRLLNIYIYLSWPWPSTDSVGQKGVLERNRINKQIQPKNLIAHAVILYFKRKLSDIIRCLVWWEGGGALEPKHGTRWPLRTTNMTKRFLQHMKSFLS